MLERLTRLARRDRDRDQLHLLPSCQEFAQVSLGEEVHTTRVTPSGNMCTATLDITASKLPSGKGSRRVMSATRNLASDPNLACACPMASPDRSTAVTE
jgi:hypothetical protein